MSDGDNEEPQFGDGIQELLARGDFAKFPREEGSSRSLTCSRLVDENNLLKPLPKVLIEGTVSASEVLELANVSQDEGMNFETSKVTSPSPSFSKAASGPAVHQPKPRKRREQRTSQGGKKVSKKTWSMVKVNSTQLCLVSSLCQVTLRVCSKI